MTRQTVSSRPYSAVAAVRAAVRAGTCAPGAVCGGGCHLHRAEPAYGLVQVGPARYCSLSLSLGFRV